MDWSDTGIIIFKVVTILFFLLSLFLYIGVLIDDIRNRDVDKPGGRGPIGPDRGKNIADDEGLHGPVESHSP